MVTSVVATLSKVITKVTWRPPPPEPSITSNVETVPEITLPVMRPTPPGLRPVGVPTVTPTLIVGSSAIRGTVCKSGGKAGAAKL